MTQNELRSNELLGDGDINGDISDHELCIAFLSDELPENQLHRFAQRLQADERFNALLAQTADLFCIVDAASSFGSGAQLQLAGLSDNESASVIQPGKHRGPVRRLTSGRIVAALAIAATIGGLVVGFALRPIEDEQTMVAQFWADQTMTSWQGSSVGSRPDDRLEQFEIADDLDSDWLSTDWMLVAMQDSDIVDTETGDRDAG